MGDSRQGRLLGQAVRPPTSDEQIRFLVNLQRLLDEGSFVASYKFALLIALADLSIERGDDSGAPLSLTTAEIAEQFITYYWRQAVPYPSPTEARVLQQNTGQQAKIVSLVRDVRASYDSLPNAARDTKAWRSLVSKVAWIVQDKPLRFLQNVGGARLEFLYADVGREIVLKPGVGLLLPKVSRAHH
jgi:hypothetical protein